MGSNDPARDGGLDSIPRRNVLKLGSVGVLGSVAGCLGGDGGGSADETTSEDDGQPLFDIDEIEPDGLVGQGPYGEDPSPTDSVALTDDEVAEIQSGEYKAEIAFHFEVDTWVRLQETAIRQRCGELGIEITGVHYPDLNPELQSDQLETIAQKDDVDAVFSIPVDIEATSDAYRAVEAAGKEIVFLDNVPVDFNHPEDYAGIVAADNRGMGVIGGRMLEALTDGGKLIVLKYEVPVYHIDERTSGLTSVFEGNDDYELIEVGFTDPNDVSRFASDTLTANPDAVGIWAPWANSPAAQAVQAAEEQGMDIPVTSTDLGERGAVLMAEGTQLKGVGSQQPFQQGLTEVDMMGKRLLGQETPPYIALPSPAVARQNLLEWYPKIMQEAPPEEVTEHFE